MQPVVTLTEGELLLARQIANFRTGWNRISGITKIKYGDSDPYANEVIGVCGEIVFGKHFNFYLDLSFEPRSGVPDFTTNNDKTWDVKTTTMANGRLVVNKAKENKPKSNYYALVTGTIPTFTIRGYASADEVFSSVIDLGYGPCFGLQQDQLHSFKRKNEKD